MLWKLGGGGEVVSFGDERRGGGGGGLKIIIKKRNAECADIQYIFVKNVCLKETDSLGKIDQICFMSDSRATFPRAEFLLSYR